MIKRLIKKRKVSRCIFKNGKKEKILHYAKAGKGVFMFITKSGIYLYVDDFNLFNESFEIYTSGYRSQIFVGNKFLVFKGSLGNLYINDRDSWQTTHLIDRVEIVT